MGLLNSTIFIIWIIFISIAVLVLLHAVVNLIDEIERIKSWYPFVELLKMRIPEDDDDNK